MLKLIKSSPLDQEKLHQIASQGDNSLDNFDFSEVVVKKPWGHEYLTYRGSDTAIWILHLKKDSLTSMHCHVHKKTSLIVLAGSARVSTLEKAYDLSEGDGLILEKGVFHSTQAVSQSGLILMEIENPARKTDLVRLKDNYGRELKGYELQNEMCFDLSEYERVYFNEKESHHPKRIGGMNICIKSFNDSSSIQSYLKMYRSSIIIILSGEVINEKANQALNVGDIIEIDEKEADLIKINGPVRILNLVKDIFDFD